jgi:hypothetical protein
MLFLCFVDYTLNIEGRSNVSGSLDIKFLNISGRICADDWDDKDASVAQNLCFTFFTKETIKSKSATVQIIINTK